MIEILNITKALSDENRIRALMMLTGGELCVCQIIEMMQLAPSTVSKHMSILKQAGLVETRKDGRWIYYRLAAAERRGPSEIIDWLKKNLKDNPVTIEDNKRLKRIKKIKNISQCYRS